MRGGETVVNILKEVKTFEFNLDAIREGLLVRVKGTLEDCETDALGFVTKVGNNSIEVYLCVEDWRGEQFGKQMSVEYIEAEKVADGSVTITFPIILEEEGSRYAGPRYVDSGA